MKEDTFYTRINCLGANYFTYLGNESRFHVFDWTAGNVIERPKGGISYIP